MRRRWAGISGFVTLGILALSCPSIGAQPLPPLDEFQIRAFDAGSGLAGADIRGLVQGADGYVYVSNSRGLMRYDGYTFHQVPLPGFRDTYILAILRDRRGRLWVRTKDSELGYFENERFVVLPPVPAKFGSWTETRDGTLWLGGVEGLIRVVPDAASPYTHFVEMDGLPSLSVAGVYDLPDGERVAVATNRLVRIERDTTKPTGIRFVPFGPAFTGAAEEVVEIRADARGLWFTALEVRQGRDHLINYHKGVFRQFGDREGFPRLEVDDLGWDSTLATTMYHSIGYYLGLRGQNDVPAYRSLRVGLAFQTRDGSRWYTLVDSENRNHQLLRRRAGRLEAMALGTALGSSRIQHLLEDREGSVWIGTDRGLLQLVPRTLFVLTGVHGLAASFTTPVLQTRDGALWVGTIGGGLHKFTNGRLSRRFTTRDGLPWNDIRSLYEAADGRLWVGTTLGYVILDADRVVRVVKTRGESRSFAEMPDGSMWIGTEHALLHEVRGVVTNTSPGVWDNRSIWALHRARDGSLWIASERGLFRMKGDVTRSFDESHGLRSRAVVSIAEEPDGTLWFGTYNDGLHRYRGARFTAITTEHGLHNNGVWRMLSDEMGGTWLSGDQGIYRVPTAALHAVADALEQGERPAETLAPIVFTESEGMPNREGNRASPVGWRLDDGRLVFNNMAGVVVIDPRRVANAPTAPRAVIEAISADGAALPLNTFRIPSNTRQLGFSFAALSFLSPEQNHFRYRVDGYDDDWVDAERVRRATYTNLPPGRFTFRVQGATATGDWSGAEASVPFEVVPMVWQTLWFRLLAATAGGILLFLAYRYRVQRLIEMERLRLRIASDLHDDVGSNLSSIALLSDMLKDVSVLDFREQRQIQRIHVAAEETIGALRDIIWLVDPKHGDLSDLAVRMRSVASDLLAGHQWTLTADESVHRALTMPTMRATLLIYKEALHNVVKHARARHVTIAIAAEQGRLVLHIEDDGIGFNGAALHEGHGLSSMQRRAESLGGSLTIDSVSQRGTQLTFAVDLR